MRRISINVLRAGMVVGRTVFSADGLVMLNRGTVIQASYIQRLAGLGIPAVYIEDNLLPDIQVNDIISEETRLRATKSVKSMLTGLEQQVRAGRPAVLDHRQVSSLVMDVVDELLSGPDLMVNLTDIRAVDDYTFGHSVNVAVLALLTGLALGYNKQQLQPLGCGALMHDIGKILVAQQVLNKPGKLSPKEFDEVKKHSYLGYDILRRQPGIHQFAREVAYQHHEKYDGKGYPQGLAGEQIHEYARIAAIVDVYDALTADRVYRKAYQPNEAFELIAGSGDYYFDYRLVQAFLENVALYPTGTLVELNTCEVAVVTNTPRGNPHRPVVRVLFDPDGQPLASPREIKLADEIRVLISRVLNEEEHQEWGKKLQG